MMMRRTAMNREVLVTVAIWALWLVIVAAVLG